MMGMQIRNCYGTLMKHVLCFQLECSLEHRNIHPLSFRSRLSLPIFDFTIPSLQGWGSRGQLESQFRWSFRLLCRWHHSGSILFLARFLSFSPPVQCWKILLGQWIHKERPYFTPNTRQSDSRASEQLRKGHKLTFCSSLDKLARSF